MLGTMQLADTCIDRILDEVSLYGCLVAAQRSRGLRSALADLKNVDALLSILPSRRCRGQTMSNGPNLHPINHRTLFGWLAHDF